MRSEDWTFREAEGRLAEHRELRQALGLSYVPDCTPPPPPAPPPGGSVGPRPGGDGAPPGPSCLLGDGGGHRADTGGGEHLLREEAQGQGRGVAPLDHVGNRGGPVPAGVLAQEARWGPSTDSATLRPLVASAARVRPLERVVAEAEFDRERNHRCVREARGAESVIPARRGWRKRGFRAQRAKAFPQHRSRRRAVGETVFSGVKRKRSSRAPGRSREAQQRPALLLGLADNIYRLKFPCSSQPAHRLRAFPAA